MLAVEHARKSADWYFSKSLGPANRSGSETVGL